VSTRGIRVRPEFVEVYAPGESIKFPSKVRMAYAEAVRAVQAKRGIFRDHRRKIVLAHEPHEPSESRSSVVALTSADAEAIAGARHLSARRRERIQGWKLLSKTKGDHQIANL
jgi:hypothetical protein